MSEGHWEIPASWEWVPLETIAEINPKLPFDLEDEVDVSFLPMSNVEEETGKIDLSETRKYGKVKRGYTKFVNDDIIFAKITPCMENGKVAILKGLKNGVGFGSTEFHVIRMRDEFFLNRFYFYFFLQQWFRNLARQHFTGTVGHRRVPTNFIREVLVPIAPFIEQFRVVGTVEELFSQLDAGVRSFQTSQSRLKKYRQTTLKQAYTGKLTEKWRQENHDIESSFELFEKIKKELHKLPPQRFSSNEIKIDELPRLPEKWSWNRIGDVFYVTLGQSPPSSTYNEDGGGLPFFQGSKEFGVKYPKTEKWCSEPKKIAEKSDVLISVRAPVGDVNIATEKCCIGRGLASIRALAGVNPVYIFHLIEFVRNDLKSKGTGTTFNAITGNVLRGHIIPLPPLKEINKIVELIEVNYSIFKHIQDNLIQSSIKSERMKQSILKKAFEGRLVPQNPDDEPADVLLKRIKAHKTKQMKLI